LTIVVTVTSDSELVIELINQAQVFRFLNKPVQVKLLRGHLESALQRYLTYKQTPRLTALQQVQASKQTRLSALGQSILDKLKSLRRN